SGARLQVPALVIGPGPYAEGLARALGLAHVEPDRVQRIEGNPVEGVRLPDGVREARLVALAAPPAPAFELARQAGAAARCAGHGSPVQRDDPGRCAHGPFTGRAAGDVRGRVGPAAAEDGHRLAQALLRARSSTTAS